MARLAKFTPVLERPIYHRSLGRAAPPDFLYLHRVHGTPPVFRIEHYVDTLATFTVVWRGPSADDARREFADRLDSLREAAGTADIPDDEPAVRGMNLSWSDGGLSQYVQCKTCGTVYYLEWERPDCNDLAVEPCPGQDPCEHVTNGFILASSVEHLPEDEALKRATVSAVLKS